MPRQARLILPSVAVHIIQRGNNRSACFTDDTDRQVYLLLLRDLSAELRCAVHAYCLMTNHVHLLLTPPTADACVALMRNLGQRYVPYFNKRHDRSGTLWEGRFRSCLTESARYVLACYRYIELNPVRAGMVDAPAHYPWSSHRANSGRHANTFLAPHPEYAALGLTSETRARAYVGLFEREVNPAVLSHIRAATNGGYPLGSEAFKFAIKPAAQRRLVPGRPGRRRRKEEADQDPANLEFGL